MTVSSAYGFSHDIGGGPDNRMDSVAPELDDVTFQVAVSQDVPAVAGQVVGTLADAVDAWNAHCAAAPPGAPCVGVIAIVDSRSYDESLTGAARLVIPAQARLMIVAAEWPELAGTPGPPRRPLDLLTPIRTRPHIVARHIGGRYGDRRGLDSRPPHSQWTADRRLSRKY